MKFSFFLLLSTAVTWSISMATLSDVKPKPLPKNIRVDSSAPRKVVWEKLKLKERELATLLFEAGALGRTLLFYQCHRHALVIRELLETSLNQKNIKQTKTVLGEEAFQEWLRYGAKFMDGHGPYDSSNRKYILEKTTAAHVSTLLNKHLKKTPEPVKKDVISLLTDPTFEVLQYPENPDGEGLEKTGGNLYEKGITGAEVKAAIANGSVKSSVNCRIVRAGKGLTCEVQTIRIPGIVGTTLRKLIQILNQAKSKALTDFQRSQIESMIAFFTAGNVEDFRKANIAWVKDRSASAVDFMIGWVEVYEDWLARIASWESYVQVVDPEVSKIAEKLAGHAQYFENGMPFGKFKKTFPADYSPPAIMVYYFQELASYHTGGYNLPNFDDIRRDVGAKNVIRLPLPGEEKDPVQLHVYEEMLAEFATTAKAKTLAQKRLQIYRAIVLMHEIIGHGSGTFDEAKYKKADGTVDDPVSGIGSLGSALEEQRADLAALVFLGDAKLVEIGYYKDATEAKAMRDWGYDYYLSDFLRRTSGLRTFTESHQRGHLLFINKLFESGAIAWASRDGVEVTDKNAVLVVNDYEKYHATSVAVLGELQDIKANRKEEELRALFAKYAALDEIDKPRYQAIIERGKDLLINAGYVEQPWKIEKGHVATFGELTLEGVAPYWSLNP